LKKIRSFLEYIAFHEICSGRRTDFFKIIYNCIHNAESSLESQFSRAEWQIFLFKCFLSSYVTPLEMLLNVQGWHVYNFNDKEWELESRDLFQKAGSGSSGSLALLRALLCLEISTVYVEHDGFCSESPT
jgi:hypothetical protein